MARRRVLLDVLTEQSEPVELSTLARLVAAIEQDDAEEVSSARQERVAITLHHVHLPKMDDFGVVEYDAETREVEPCRSRIYSLLG